MHSSDSNQLVPADPPGRMDAAMTPAERMRELAGDPYVRNTETRASLEFHRCAHENQAKWWVVEKQAYLVYPRNPSIEELREALENPADTLDATLGEMAAANYAATIIQALVNGAMFSIQGPELETFIQECIRTYTEKACKLLRPASENEDSRNRVGHFIDLGTTTALTSIRMVSHVQAGLKNGMEWDELAQMVPRRSAPPDDDDEIEAALTDADHGGAESGIPTAQPRSGQNVPIEGVDGSQAALAARRRAVVMPILKQKRWTRGKWATQAGVGKNSIYEYLDGTRNPGNDNRQAMADALGLKLEELPE